MAKQPAKKAAKKVATKKAPAKKTATEETKEAPKKIGKSEIKVKLREHLIPRMIKNSGLDLECKTENKVTTITGDAQQISAMKDLLDEHGIELI